MTAGRIYWIALHILLSAALAWVFAICALAVVGVGPDAWCWFWIDLRDALVLISWALVPLMMIFGTYGRPFRGVWLAVVSAQTVLIIAAFFGHVVLWGQVSFRLASELGVSLGDATVLLLPAVLAILGWHILQLARAPAGAERSGRYTPLGLGILALVTILGAFSVAADFVAMDAVFDEVRQDAAATDSDIPPSTIAAQPLAVPAHILPEWNALASYAVLRAVPFGWLMGASVAAAYLCLWAALPWLDRGKPGPVWRRPGVRWVVLGTGVLWLALCFTGAAPARGLAYSISQVATLGLFALFLVILPWQSRSQRTQ